jgi:hypothetical protein
VTPTWPPTHTPPPGWSPIATIHLPVAHKHGEG